MKGLVAEGTAMRSRRWTSSGYFHQDAVTGPVVVEEEEPGGVREQMEKWGLTEVGAG